jgi:RNA polymerase sporulation-specific sigma factor
MIIVNMNEILQDENRINDFLQENKNLIYKIIYKHFPNLLKTQHADDYVLEGMLGLYDAMKRYNASKNCEFSTFAYLCIKTSIIKKIKSIHKKHNTHDNNAISIYSTMPDDIDDIMIIEVLKDKMNIEQIIERAEERKETLHRRKDIIKTLNANLSPRRKEIFQHLLQKKPQAQIARELGCSREYIRISVKSILEEARKICA